MIDKMLLYYLQADKKPPMHMSISSGSIVCKKTAPLNGCNSLELPSVLCVLCARVSSMNSLLICINPNCRTVTHILCLAKRFLTPSNHTIPVDGECPACGIHVLWADLIRKKYGCYSYLNVENTPQTPTLG